MKNKTIFPAKLYHGTDKRIYSSTQEERAFFSELCLDILKFVYPIFINDGMSVSNLSNLRAYKAKRGDLIGQEWNSFMTYFQRCYSYLEGSGLYQYNSFYLSNSVERATDYARVSMVYGEKGHIASILYRNALKIWDIKKDASKDMLRKMEIFEGICQHNPEPIILVFENVPEQYLLSEDGKLIDWETMGSAFSSPDSRISLRCTPDFPISEFLSSIRNVE